MTLGPGMQLVCTQGGGCFCGCSSVTEQAIYTCEEIDLDVLGHTLFCTIEGCVMVTIFIVGKEHGFCANRFKPLNDGDTSLVEEEETYDDMLAKEKETENV